MTLPFEAQLGVAALVIGVLLIGAGTKRFGRLWVFGWYATRLENENADLKRLLGRALGNTDKATTLVEKSTKGDILTPEKAEQAWRVLVEAGLVEDSQ